jgi:hypothetical protein
MPKPTTPNHHYILKMLAGKILPSKIQLEVIENDGFPRNGSHLVTS